MLTFRRKDEWPFVSRLLSENTASNGDFFGEWGVSILVETEEVTVLVDTGRATL